MPELPEVERFREVLLPLISTTCCLEINCPSPNPPKKFLSIAEQELLRRSRVKDVIRKGKLICLVLETNEKGETSEPKEKNEAYCFLHMGMTGRISNPKYVPKLESLSKTDKYPPPHTHLVFRVDNYEAAFSDPRKFGAIKYADTLAEFDELAPDGLNEEINPESLIGKKKGIKSILLDQKAAVSGIGNWVADEVLYQSKIHPDQSFLDTDEVKGLLSNLIRILRTAVHCLKSDEEFPEEWIFNFRWKKGQAKNETIKDFKGRPISFVTAGGRGSAIVKSIQKLSKRSKAKQGNFSEIDEENATCNTIETRVMQKRSREAVPEPAATVLKKRSLSLRIKREI